MNKLVKPLTIAAFSLAMAFGGYGLAKAHGQKANDVSFIAQLQSYEALASAENAKVLSGLINQGAKIDVTPVQVDGKVRFLVIVQPK